MNVKETNRPTIKAAPSRSPKAANASQNTAGLGQDTFVRSKTTEVMGSRPNGFPHQAKNAVWAGVHNQELLDDPGFADTLPPGLRKVTELNHKSSTGEDLPTLFKQLHDASKGQHVYLDIDSHGGGGNGVVFTATDPQDPATRLVNVYSIAYINRELTRAGFKPEDVTVFYEGCNSATAAFRTAQGFSSQGKKDIQDKETRWQKQDYPGTKHVKVVFHDVESAERGHVPAFPAVGRMNQSTVSVAMQFRLGKTQLTPGDWTTGIYWIDGQQKAPRYLEGEGGLKAHQDNRPALFDAYEDLAKEEAPSIFSRLLSSNR